MTPDPRETVLEDLRGSKKYGDLCDDTLERMADWALARFENPKQAAKAARRKLHQVYGAYFEPADVRFIEHQVGEMAKPIADAQLRQVCRSILERHASTAERLPIIDTVYERIFAETGLPHSILDLACGLHPFALPWMRLPEGCQYTGIDIDKRLAEAAGRFFRLTGLPGIAQCADILVKWPQTPVDVTFLLKTLPCLEQQEKNAAISLFKRLQTRHAVVSFPVRSLSGKNKGMPAHYETAMDALLDAAGLTARKICLSCELFYIIPFQNVP